MDEKSSWSRLQWQWTEHIKELTARWSEDPKDGRKIRTFTIRPLGSLASQTKQAQEPCRPVHLLDH